MTSVHPSLDVRVFHKEARSLARAGYEVILVAVHAKDELREGVRIKGISPAGTSRFLRMTLTAWQVFRAALKTGAKVCHFHDPELIPAGIVLRLLGRRVIYDIHENLPQTIQDKYYLPEWIRGTVSWLVRCLENIAVPWFTALIAVTPAIAERFRRPRRRVVVVSNFPVMEEFARKSEVPFPDRRCCAVYLGIISRNRGAEEMVDAISLLPGELQPRLKLAGKFVPEEYRNALSAREGWKRVDYLGEIDRDRVISLLGETRVGLVVIRPEKRFLDSYPIKLFEYMAAGIPVVASDFALWRGIVKESDCGLLVDPRDTQAIASAIEYLFDHPQEAASMGEKGRVAVMERYNWATEERKLLDLYSEVMK